MKLGKSSGKKKLSPGAAKAKTPERGAPGSRVVEASESFGEDSEGRNFMMVALLMPRQFFGQ
jgi:hypothetical protein